MKRRRTPEELKIIDKFIAENYPEKGPDYCASHLKVGLSYVVSRACTTNVKYNKPEGQKYETKLEEIERLKKNNKELRAEMIKVIIKNMALKTALTMVKLEKVKHSKALMGGIVPGNKLTGEIVTVDEVNKCSIDITDRNNPLVTFNPNNPGRLVITKIKDGKNDSN